MVKKNTSSNAPAGLLQGSQGRRRVGSPQFCGGVFNVVDWFYFQRSSLLVLLTLNYFCQLQLQSGLHRKAFWLRWGKWWHFKVSFRNNLTTHLVTLCDCEQIETKPSTIPLQWIFIKLLFIFIPWRVISYTRISPGPTLCIFNPLPALSSTIINIQPQLASHLTQPRCGASLASENNIRCSHSPSRAGTNSWGGKSLIKENFA